MLVLNAEEVRQALPMKDAIDAMRRAFAALSDGRAVVPMRAHIDVPSGEGVTLIMPSLVRGEKGGEEGGDGSDERGDAMAVKVVSLFGTNPARGLPLLNAAVLVIAPDTGVPTALLEGATLTAIRTGAASGLATELLAREESCTVAVLGAGVQARTQLEAVCTARRIETVWAYDPDAERLAAFAADVAGKGPVPEDVRRAASAGEAVSHADIVCAATTSAEPVFDDADVRTGTHVNAIGSYKPHVQELPPETVARALVVVDSREAALAETGDLIKPINEGLITAEHVHADLGELVLGRKPGRTSADQVTLFKSVGVAVQDAVAAQAAVGRAEREGLGVRVRL